jgi:hypothetical protein
MAIRSIRTTAVLSFAFGAIILLAQSLGIDQPYAGDRNVTGQGMPGSAPLTVYEVVGTSRNYLGKSNSVDQQGFYAVAVSPMLTDGQRIVVVDGLGRSSTVATVVVKTGPAGPGN